MASSAKDVLHLWETGQHLLPVDQGVLLLGAARPSASWEQLALLPIGRRNVELLQWHTQQFGIEVPCWVACPECSAKLEFDVDCSALAATRAAEPGQTIQTARGSFRVPNSNDLAAAIAQSSPQDAARSLVQNCSIAQPTDSELAGDDLDAIAEMFAFADPAADTLLDLKCNDCGHTWNEPFDVVATAWTKIEAEARRFLLDVHTLASAYGWTEPDVLALSTARRNAYLQMVHT